MWLSGCAIYDAAIVGLHDSLDEMKQGDTAKPPAADIKPDPTVRYNGGNFEADKGEEIWTLWHGMNIRVHANPGELRGIVPLAGRWYPLNMAIMPADIVTLTRTATGATFTAKDFTAQSGQRYRFEGFRADKIGTLSKVYTLALTDSQMGGALLVWYATVE
jgi:hypothetical protein